MSSTTTSTVRRVKERGGAGGKITALKPSPKPQSPFSDNNIDGGSNRKPSFTAGKENTCSTLRSISATRSSTLRSVIKPVPIPQISKDASVRSSTSSVPRGRSSSPSDFARILSDRMSRVSVSDRSNGRTRPLERSHSQKANSASKSKLDKPSVNEVVSKSKVDQENLKLDRSNDKVRSFMSSIKNKNGRHVNGLHDLEGGSNVKVVENGNSEEGKSVRVGKYSSKLHEKLAFLEGKVKRIASDIKKTKEMLDMNNPDASKMIISDIQEKISGIEKAMVHVGNGSGNGNEKHVMLEATKIVESNNDLVSTQKKQSVKDLNNEELEARLFPHHKLLKGRTSLKSSSTSSQNDLPQRLETGGQEVEDMVLSPSEQNSIALEFLDSLNKKSSKVTTRIEHARLDFDEVQEMDGPSTSAEKENSTTLSVGNFAVEVKLTTDELIEEFDDDQENRPGMVIEEIEETCMDQLNDIGQKTATGGWFVSEGESILLAHDDGSCTYYDIANLETKAEYKPPAVVTPNIWGDCWLVRAPDSDGCSGRFVVAASSGNTLDSGFCAWDFYTKDIRSFHVESETAKTSSRTVLGPLSNSGAHRRNALSTIMSSENQQWWYKPCGHLIASTASSQRAITVYDIRDGEQVMKWESQRPVITMDYSSPLQWRNRGKVVIAEAETINLWDVNSLTPQALLTIPSSGRKVSALHVNNTDAELGGGIRRRASSSEVEGHDGVFCTQDTINVFDFRLPSGVGLKISKIGVSVQSVYSRGDSIFLGCADKRLGVQEHARSCVQQFSLRKGRLASTYALPESNAHYHYSAISQVWGDSAFVMGVCGLGLFVFDASKEEGTPTLSVGKEKARDVREIIGPADLYAPSFDYMSSRVLLISRDRPAMWRYFS